MIYFAYFLSFHISAGSLALLLDCFVCHCLLASHLFSFFQMECSKQMAKSDVDRQFEEDLERASALSLESLALEKFKLRKQQIELEKLQEGQICQHQPNAAQPIRKPEAFERKLSIPHTSSSNVSDRLELKSRPRPGSFNSGI